MEYLDNREFLSSDKWQTNGVMVRMVGENWSYLCGVTQDLEADIIIGLLNEDSIPAIKQYPEAGAFLKIAYGLTTGVDLYVPTETREAALQLIQESLSVPIDNEDENEEANVKEAETMHDASVSASLQTSHVHLWIIIFAILLLVFAFVYNSHISW
ncbi:hypothetical protein [Desulfosporosinus sp. OT]|uniref:hypothetical protein n=1 Tax=Desulfosporosinus sp. OT TaxID=913865 RepID=UPI0002239AD9|nr:hypothetical protein [Desulfosporosinus sp. OT]EGW41595.1 hypothetical protein DOT_0448 [Desulfosporosinus sp. OT]